MNADYWANIIHQRRRQQAETVRCPVCDAYIGKPCTAVHHTYISVGKFHVARYTLWRDTTQ